MTSTDDYVFGEAPNGELELIGDFDALYREDQDPWDQSAERGSRLANYYLQSRWRLLFKIVGTARELTRSVLEVGCGHGHFLDTLQRELHVYMGDNMPEVLLGMDISPHAIERAREVHPNISFCTGDIMAKDLTMPDDRTYDVVVLNQVLWYVLHEIDQTIDNCLKLLRPGGRLIICQGFLPPESQRYAVEWTFMETLRDIAARSGLTLIDARYDDVAIDGLHDAILVYRKAME
jgi:SAM-dependent methyltransferase